MESNLDVNLEFKIDILAIGAHPDDIELGAGATIAKEIARGKKVGVLDLTRGELGTRGNADLRKIESSESSKYLGLSFRYNLDLGDGFFENNKKNQLRIIEVIRMHKPKIVLINAVSDRHPDHSRANKLASTACYLSGLKKIETTFNNVEQDSWRPENVYSYIQWEYIKPDFVVDVSDFLDKKLEAIECYKSQFYNPNSKEPETPISSKNFLNSITNVASEFGKITGVKYAEGFNTERYPLVDSLFDIK